MENKIDTLWSKAWWLAKEETTYTAFVAEDDKLCELPLSVLQEW